MAYNLFANDKQKNYPGYQQQQQNQQQPTIPGQVQGATVQDFAAGKQAANSQAQGYGANPVTPTQPIVQTDNGIKDVPKSQGTVSSGVQNYRGSSIDPNSPTSGMDAVIANMYTSPEQEEKMRKASVANQRILAVADALRHIGNIAHTVNYAPSQQFNQPWAEAQARYQQGKALRDRANQTYLSYQQQKAAQDAKQKQWETQFNYNMAKDARDYELKKSESEARNNLREAQLNRYQTMMALDEARREGIISDNEYKKRRAELYPEEVRSRIAKNNRTGGGRSGGGSGTEWTRTSETKINRDEEGRETGRTTTIHRSNSKTGENSSTTKTTQPKKIGLKGNGNQGGNGKKIGLK